MEFATIILTDEFGHTAGMLLVDVTGESPQIVREAWNSFVEPTHAYLCNCGTGGETEEPYSVAAPADVRNNDSAAKIHLARLYDALPK